MEVQDRIDLLIKSLGENQNSFSKKLGVSNTVIGHIVKGNSHNEGKRNKPSFDLLTKITDTFPEVSLYWLVKGEGSMFLNETSKPITTKHEEGNTNLIDTLFSKIDSLEKTLMFKEQKEMQYLETINNLSKH